jgi:hypothetical protein
MENKPYLTIAKSELVSEPDYIDIIIHEEYGEAEKHFGVTAPVTETETLDDDGGDDGSLFATLSFTTMTFDYPETIPILRELGILDKWIHVDSSWEPITSIEEVTEFLQGRYSVSVKDNVIMLGGDVEIGQEAAEALCQLRLFGVPIVEYFDPSDVHLSAEEVKWLKEHFDVDDVDALSDKAFYELSEKLFNIEVDEVSKATVKAGSGNYEAPYISEYGNMAIGIHGYLEYHLSEGGSRGHYIPD